MSQDAPFAAGSLRFLLDCRLAQHVGLELLFLLLVEIVELGKWSAQHFLLNMLYFCLWRQHAEIHEHASAPGASCVKDTKSVASGAVVLHGSHESSNDALSARVQKLSSRGVDGRKVSFRPWVEDLLSLRNALLVFSEPHFSK